MLTIIIPCYNERNTIEKLVKKILSVKDIKKQIIIIDDGSSDGSTEILQKKLLKKVDKIIFLKKNRGKGFAIQQSRAFIKGSVVIIQDADLEYDPRDYKFLIKPIINNESNVVYGSRFLNKRLYKNYSIFSIKVIGNKLLTFFSNILNQQSLTDAHTCYKILRVDLFKKIKLNEKGFSFCAELTTQLSNLNEKIIEKPIHYFGRGYKEGKKISFLDAFKTVHVIIKLKLKNLF